MINKASESAGMNVLRPLAASKLKNSYDKNRIWSTHYECWGFFDDDITMLDEFLLWCSIKPGDRILLDSFQQNKEIFTVVKIWKDQEIREAPLWIFRLLGPHSKIFDVKIKEKELFVEASKLI